MSHEIFDVLTPKAIKAYTLREARQPFRLIGKALGVSDTGGARNYYRAVRRVNKWLEYNAAPSNEVLKELLPITNHIKELTK